MNVSDIAAILAKYDPIDFFQLAKIMVEEHQAQASFLEMSIRHEIYAQTDEEGIVL
jgi:hypothetical protein